MDVRLKGLLRILAQKGPPLIVVERRLRHDVLDGVGAAGEVVRGLGMIAVFQAREQKRCLLEPVDVARAQCGDKLAVGGKAPWRAILAHQHDFQRIGEVLSHLPGLFQACDERGEELVEAVGRYVAGKSAEDIAFDDARCPNEPVMSKGAALVAAV